jgi:hypothetical protein
MDEEEKRKILSKSVKRKKITIGHHKIRVRKTSDPFYDFSTRIKEKDVEHTDSSRPKARCLPSTSTGRPCIQPGEPVNSP